MSKDLPEAKYTKLGEKIRQAIPGPMQCSMACGGRNCKWENPSKWRDQDQVIKGVFSSWVLDDVVAMSRPSTEVIQKYNLIKQFKDNNISSIINLQRPGEHASCGPPLHKDSQFTYLPQAFMDNDIFFYNFGWKDYGVTSLETILDMVKVMSFALSEGKVAVHCHAGLGRTGVLIACYLVYAHRMDASSAINTVRKRRPNSIQTRGQIACIQEFAQFLKPLRIVFPQVVPRAERLTLTQFLHRQRHLLHGFESRELRYIPKIVNMVCQRLVQIATTSQDISFYETRARVNTGLKSRKKKGTLRRSNTIETLKETLPRAFVNEHIQSDDGRIDPAESQKIKALLSPRVSRKSNSAKSNSSTEPKSQSRPESPTTDLTNTPDRQKAIPPNKSEPILVASVSSQPNFAENMEDSAGKDAERVPGKPKVVLVKQGSRSKLSSAANVSQSQDGADINLNNNNQVVSSVTPNLRKETPSNPNGSIAPSNEIVPSEKEKGEAGTYAEDPAGVVTHFADLLSPTASDQEPQLSPRFKNPEKDTQKAAGDKPTSQNIRASAGRQQRVIPTDLPVRRINSSKGLKLSLLVGDSNPHPGGGSLEDVNLAPKDEVKEEKAEEENPSPTENPDVVETEDEAKESVVLEPEDAAKDLNEVEKGISATDNLDDELDEIIEMKDDGGHFLSESESEKEDSKSEKDAFSKSTASKVSWSERKNNEEDEALPRDCDSSRQSRSASGRQTPLMYRAGNTQELLAEADSNGTEEDAGDVAEDNYDSNEIEHSSTESTNKTSPMHRRRPKSAGFLRRLAEKNQNEMKTPPLKTLGLTQSLCDLRSYEKTSKDDLALMRPEMSSQLFLPLSPSSKSSSSDDVRTPTGSATKRRIKDPITVAMALSYKLTDDEWLWEKVYTKQVELNTREGAWSSVGQEVDAHILSCLMWSWIEHLSEPVLSLENVETLIRESRPEHDKSTSITECPEPYLFEDALSKLGKPISSTLRCVLHCLVSLPPLSFELEASVVKRVTSAFTQTNMHDEESEENTEDKKKQEQLVSLIQNYLVKTRARTVKKQSSAGEKSLQDSEAMKKNVTETANTEKNLGVIKTDAVNDEFPKGEGDSVSSASKVSELRPRIAVS